MAPELCRRVCDLINPFVPVLEELNRVSTPRALPHQNKISLFTLQVPTHRTNRNNS